MTNAIPETPRGAAIDPEYEQLQWRRSLKVGDEVGIACQSLPEIGHWIETITRATSKRVDTAYGHFWRETGMETYRPSSHMIVPPTAEGVAIREAWMEKEALLRRIRKVDMSKEPMHRLRAIAWLLDIDHGPGPTFGGRSFDPIERAELLEAIKASVGFDKVGVDCLSYGSFKTSMRQARANVGRGVMRDDQPAHIYMITEDDDPDSHSFKTVAVVGNHLDAEAISHLICYALEALPDYCRLLREERRTNERIDRLTSAVLRLRGHADVIEPNAGIDKPHTADTITWDADGDAVYAAVDDDNSDRLSYLWGKADGIIACLVERLGGRVVLTDTEMEAFLPGRAMNTAWYDDRIVIEMEGGK